MKEKNKKHSPHLNDECGINRDFIIQVLNYISKTNFEFKKKDLPFEIRIKYLGGRGLTKIYYFSQDTLIFPDKQKFPYLYISLKNIHQLQARQVH